MQVAIERDVEIHVVLGLVSNSYYCILFFLNSSKGQQLTHPLLMFRPVVKKKGEEEDSMMARRTRGTSGPA